MRRNASAADDGSDCSPEAISVNEKSQVSADLNPAPRVMTFLWLAS